MVTNIEDELYEYEDLDGENYSYDFESDHAEELEPDEEQELKTKQPENKATKPSRLNIVGIRQKAVIKVNQNCSVNLSCSVPHALHI